jgi:hypothetical protein
MIKPLTFIEIIDENGRVSSLSIFGNRDNKKLNVVGSLPHRAAFIPKTENDRNKLVKWLNELKYPVN